jgi:hypothetical protein
MKMDIQKFTEDIETGFMRNQSFELVQFLSFHIESISVDYVNGELKAGIGITAEFAAGEKENDLTELIIYRKKISEIKPLLGSEKISMLVNPSNTGGDICGLNIVSGAESVDITSSWYSILASPEDNNYVLFGFIHPVAHRTFLRIKNGYFECGCIVQQNMKSGDLFKIDKLFMACADSPDELFKIFGLLCVKDVHAKTLNRDYIGWNSWDYYFKNFESADLQENMDVIQSFNENSQKKIKMLMLDDGWFNDYGDWRSNGRFPEGLKSVADKIKNAGFDAGIWIAPFHVSYFSRAFQHTPEILTSFRDGKKRLEEWAFGPLGFLDPTNPVGAKFLSDTFKSLKEAGFSCFKVDFIHYLITFGKDKQFFNDKLGRIEIVRRGLSIIRDAIGEDSYLLTCGCPPEAAIGIADINRIGGDISTYDSTVKLNAKFLAARYWMNNVLWTSDPDFLIVRSDATAEDRHHNPIHFNLEKGSRSGSVWETENSSRVWATLAAMSGGFMVLADNLGKLKNNGVKIIRTVLGNATSDTAIPLDLMENELPKLWFRKSNAPAFAVINWSDVNADIMIDLETFPELQQFTDTVDIWNEIKVSRIYNKKISVNLPPMDVAWFIKRGKI